MESFTNILSIAAGAVSSIAVGFSLWRMFRTPQKLTVTRKDTGKSVVLDTNAGWQEGSKLSALL